MQKLSEEQKLLAEENIGLVYFVLKRTGISYACGEFEDLFGAGCLGLCRAALVWKRGLSPFSTFACHLIRHEIIGALKAFGRDKRVLRPFEEFSEIAAEPDELLQKKEADLLLTGFLDFLGKCYGETDAAVVRLASGGKNPQEIANALGIGVSAVYKAKKRARSVLCFWLAEGEKTHGND